MKLFETSDYIIFFDDVRVDPYVINWNTNLGLFASDATASVTMFRTDAMDNWKAYLTQVRVFTKNVFTGKFGMVFEGEIINRSWNGNRSDMGRVTFLIKGFYHWLDVSIPLMISSNESINNLKRFMYEAQNINVEEVRSLMDSQSDVLMKEKTIEEVIEFLFQKLNSGYYELAKENSSFGWAKVQDRFKVMVDVLRDFRDAGFMDLFTFVKATQIQTFYVYLNEVLSQLMFEFYQDRDGTFKIKTPSWKDQILKNHVIDEFLVNEISGADNWEQEPTRVLTIGGGSEFMQNDMTGYGEESVISTVPVGLYIGSPEKGEYFSQAIEMYLQEYGVGMDEITAGGAVSNGEWFDNLTDVVTITSGHRTVNKGRPTHQGTDYGVPEGDPVYSIGTSGKVVRAQKDKYPGQKKGGGNYVIVEQSINGQAYQFVYMHLSRMDVKEGQQLSPGQQIGLCGNTGHSYGAHVHLEIWKGGKFTGGTDLNPAEFLKAQKEVQSAKSSVPTTGSGTWTDYLATAYIAMCEPVTINGRHYKGCTGITATGYDVRNTIYYEGMRIIAVDPKDIPLHSIVDLDVNGQIIRAIALDTGGDIKKKRIDFLVPDKATGMQFGRKKIKIRMVRKGKGDGKTPAASKNAKTTTPTTSDPFANMDSTSNLPSSLKKMKSYDYKDYLKDKDELKAIKYKSYFGLQYYVPNHASEYTNTLSANPSGVDGNLIASIIGVTSGWREKYTTNSHVGLAALPTKYVQDVFGGKDPQNGYTSIEESAKFLSKCLERFSNKVTFALAAYWLGGMSKVEEITKQVGGLDFPKARASFNSDTLHFVDSVIQSYLDIGNGDYLTGDPHKDFGIKTDVTTGNATENAPGSDELIPDYESNYKPMLSDEELKYKVNLKIVEQQLIRNDSSIVTSGVMTADELVYRYSKYVMQLERANAHNIGVSLVTSIPSLRPGFNAWLEPSRTDLVFYVTGITHQGSYSQGCFTSMRGSFARRPDKYDEIDDSIFIGEQRAHAADFGAVVKKEEMSALRSKLVNFHQKSDVVKEAHNTITLRDLYEVPVKDNLEYVTQWNQEYTVDEIEKKINDLYASAPDVIKKRSEEIKKVINDSEDAFFKYLLMNKFGG